MEVRSNKGNRVRRGILLFLIVWMGVTAFSQSSTPFIEKVIMEYSVKAFAKFGSESPVSLHARWGYEVQPRFGVYVSGELSRMSFRQGQGVGEYYSSNSLGGGISYRILESNEAFLPLFRTMDINAMCGTTVGNVMWKYTLYDIGLTLKTHRHRAFTIGVGYRIMDSRSVGVKTQRDLYASLGVNI